MRRRLAEPSRVMGLFIGFAILLTGNVASATVLVTGTELVTTLNGAGNITQDTFLASAVIDASNSLVASQNGILTYLANRGGDPFPAFDSSVEKTLRVSLRVGSTPVLFSDPRFAWDLKHTNTGGGLNYPYESYSEMSLSLFGFVDANGNDVFDSGETLTNTGVAAVYVISGVEDAGVQLSSGVVSDLRPYGTGTVDALLNANSHYVLMLGYFLDVSAPDVSAAPTIPSIESTLDAMDPTYVGPQWMINLQPVPEPSTFSLLLMATPLVIFVAMRRLF